MMEPIPNPSIWTLIVFLIQKFVRYPYAGLQQTYGCLCGYARREGHGYSVTRCAHCRPDDPDVVDFDLKYEREGERV
jgi:hypothetical protein